MVVFLIYVANCSKDSDVNQKYNEKSGSEVKWRREEDEVEREGVKSASYVVRTNTVMLRRNAAGQ